MPITRGQISLPIFLFPRIGGRDENPVPAPQSGSNTRTFHIQTASLRFHLQFSSTLGTLRPTLRRELSRFPVVSPRCVHRTDSGLRCFIDASFETAVPSLGPRGRSAFHHAFTTGFSGHEDVRRVKIPPTSASKNPSHKIYSLGDHFCILTKLFIVGFFVGLIFWCQILARFWSVPGSYRHYRFVFAEPIRSSCLSERRERKLLKIRHTVIIFAHSIFLCFLFSSTCRLSRRIFSLLKLGRAFQPPTTPPHYKN